MEVHSSAMSGDFDTEDVQAGWPDIRDIPRVFKCVYRLSFYTVAMHFQTIINIYNTVLLTSISYGLRSFGIVKNTCTKYYSMSQDICKIINSVVTGSIRPRPLINLQNGSAMLNPIVCQQPSSNSGFNHSQFFSSQMCIF